MVSSAGIRCGIGSDLRNIDHIEDTMTTLNEMTLDEARTVQLVTLLTERGIAYKSALVRTRPESERVTLRAYVEIDHGIGYHREVGYNPAVARDGYEAVVEQHIAEALEQLVAQIAQEDHEHN